MSQERNEQIEVTRGRGFQRRQRVREVKEPTRNVLVSRISQILWVVAFVIMALVGFRFVLKLIAANPGSGFVALVYSITDVLVAPFNLIINDPLLENGGIIDTGAIFAFVVYPLVIWVIVALFQLIFRGRRRARSVVTMEEAEL